MKTINVVFTDEEWKKIQKAKEQKVGKQSWHHFMLTFAKGISVKKELKGGRAKNEKKFSNFTNR